MPERAEELVQDFIGSAHIFMSAVQQTIEKKLLQEVAGRKLTHAQLRLLKMVALTEARTVRDVALFLRVSNAAASKAVDKLVRLKLLRRAQGETDRREVRISLTEASRKLLLKYDTLRDEKLQEVFKEFSEQELRRSAALLDKLSAGLLDHGMQPEEICLQCGIYFRKRCLVRQIVKRNCFYHREEAPA